MENINTVLRKGFQTWTHNLNICIPFFLNIFAGIFAMFVLFMVAVIIFVMPAMQDITTDPTNINPEMAFGVLTAAIYENMGLFILLFITAFVVSTLISSYFYGGAIGMAKKALEDGSTSINEMFTSGKKNLINLFLTRFIVMLIMLAGIIFVVPGILAIGDLSILMQNPEEALSGTLILVFGIFAWIFYAIVVKLIFTFAEYALVVGGLEPLEALEEGFSFFMNNKLDTVILWLVLIGLSILTGVAGEVLSSIEILSTFWSFADFVLSFAVIQPLTVLWWTRMYLSGKSTQFYDIDDYLKFQR